VLTAAVGDVVTAQAKRQWQQRAAAAAAVRAGSLTDRSHCLITYSCQYSVQTQNYQPASHASHGCGLLLQTSLVP